MEVEVEVEVGSFTVIWYNCHLFQGSPASLYPPLVYRDKDRRKELVRQVQQSRPDVLVLCEVWSDTVQNKIISKLKDILPYSVKGGVGSWFTNSSGLIFMSTHPISKQFFTRYTNLVGADSWSRKGILQVSFTVNAKEVHLFATHTQANGNEEAISARSKNISQLGALVQTVGDESPVIIMGDLNIPRTALLEYNHMKNTFTGFEDAWEKIYGTEEPGYTYEQHNSLVNRWDPNATSTRLDYCWFLSKPEYFFQVTHIDILKWETKDGCPVSDHNGFKITFATTE